MRKIPVTLKVLDAVTATTTSETVDVGGAYGLSIQGVRANDAGGTSTFSLLVSNDGTTFITYNGLITNVTNTIGQTPVRAASVAVAASDGTVLAKVDDFFGFRYVQVKVTETADGTHSAYLHYYV